MSAFVINIIYDSSADSAPAGFKTAIQDAVQELESVITAPVTVNINVGYGEIDGQPLDPNTLGESQTFLANYDYSAIKTALAAIDPTAAANLPSTAPGAMWLATAEAKALGLAAPSTDIDGFAGFSSAFPLNYDPNNRAAPGGYDFIGIVEHEFTEIMGRFDVFGSTINSTPNSYTLLDLLHYTAPGVHTYTGTTTNYFSIDNGTTNLDNFNTDPNGDLGDWAGSAGHDSFLAFSPAGQLDQLSQSDIAEMAALGYSSGGIVVTANSSDAVQGGAAVALLSGTPMISDSTTSTLSGATIKITGSNGSAVAGDQLFINGQQSGTVAGGAITVSWNATTHTLTLTGNASIATYQALLAQVTYQDTGTDASSGSHPQHTVTWTVSDGGQNLSTTSQIQIDRLPSATNDTITALSGTTVSATAAAGVLANDSDVDGDALTVTSVSDTAHGAGVVGQALTGVYGQLTLNANGSYTYAANITSAINSAPAGSHAHDTFTYTESDGNGGSTTASLTLTIDRAPVVSVSNLTLTKGATLVAASSLFTASDVDGDAITQYDFWDTGTGGGHFVLNGVTLGANQDNFITAAQLAQLQYQGGTGTDTLWVAANDGTLWSGGIPSNIWAGSQAFTVSAPVDHAPVVSVSNVTLTLGHTLVAASSLFTASDVDGDAVTQYDFWDTGTGGGHFVLNGVTLGANQDNFITAAQLAQLQYLGGTSTDTLWVAANDGTLWSGGNPANKWAGSQAFTVSAPVDHPPVVSVSNVTLTKGATLVAASSLFTASDPDGDVITQYDFWDTGAGGGHFVLNGVTLGANQDNFITAAQLAQLQYQGGTGTDTLRVAANDGTVWSGGNPADKWAGSQPFTVSAPVDHAPVVSVSNVTLTKGATLVAASSLFTASDVDGDAITQYDFWDTGTGGGHFVLNGVTLGANQDNFITAAQLAQLQYQGGTGTDTLWVAANDGTLWSGGNPANKWAGSQAFTVSAPVDHAPVVSASNVTLTKGATLVAASSLFTASDVDGDAITQYDFWDTGAGGGHFVLNGVTLGANQDNFITAAQLAQLQYQGGTGTDTLRVAANDGTLWSGGVPSNIWAGSQPFTVSAPVDHAPVVSVSNLTLTKGATLVAASSLFTASDVDGDAITQYDFWDTGVGGGHFVLNGVTLGANQDNFITAAQLAQLKYQGGTGTDTLWVAANDGTLWSGGIPSNMWAGSQAFTVSAPVNHAPVVSVSNVTLTKGATLVAASSLFTASDVDGDAITQYDFWDTGTGGGHFVLNGVTLGANQDNFITAAQLAQLQYQGGTGTDTLWVAANDGTLWSGGNPANKWAGSQAFTVSAPVDHAPVVSVSNVTLTLGNTLVAASSLFTASDVDGDAVTQYDFWDTGAGGGHFVLNGVTLGANQDNFITAAQLAQLQYQGGTGTDTLWVAANDGTLWSGGNPANKWAGSQAFTVTAGSASMALSSSNSGSAAPVTIGDGGSAELGANANHVIFAGPTGTLQLDVSSSFTGQISGFGGQDQIDLRDIAFGAHTMLGYSQDAAVGGGTLTVSDGTHSANIALLGNYMASQFATSSDGHGGTMLVNQPGSSDQQIPFVASPASTHG